MTLLALSSRLFLSSLPFSCLNTSRRGGGTAGGATVRAPLIVMLWEREEREQGWELDAEKESTSKKGKKRKQ
jgi:hypothetical protein